MATPAARAAPPPPASAYGHLPAISSGALSPDGKNVALVVASGDDRGALVISTADGKKVTGLRVPDGVKVRDIEFATNDWVLVELSQANNPLRTVGIGNSTGLYEFFRYYTLSLTSKARGVLGNNFESAWLNPGMPIWANLAYATAGKKGRESIPLVAYERSDGRRSYNVYDADLATGNLLVRVRGGDKTTQFFLDAKGEAVARADESETRNTYDLLLRDGKNWKPIRHGVSLTGGNPYEGVMFGGGAIVSISRAEHSDHTGVYATTMSENPTTTLIYADKDADIRALILDPRTQEVVGARLTKDGADTHFFDPALQATYEELAPNFPNGGFELLSWDVAKATFLVRGDNESGIPHFYLFDRASRKMRRLGSEYPDLDNAVTSERQAIQYKARDKTDIPAYLTLPGDGPRKNLPTVILPHGGPAARDYLAFDFIAEFLASRGYAVLQPNFRGSKGYGDAWERDGWGQWGGLMQNDVTDGLAALIRAGIADPKRVCIVGASYGGYAALAGATLTPELYACAVSIAGVSDLDAILDRTNERSGETSSSADYWRLSIGDADKDRTRIRAVSPALHADAVRAPIMLLHGKDDSVVNVEQSRTMARKLKAVGKPYELIELDGGDHWLSTAETRTKILEEVERFLAANIGAGAAAKADVAGDHTPARSPAP